MTPFEADHQSQITAPLFLWFIRLCCCCGQNHQGEIFYPWFHPAVHFEFKTMLHCFAANCDQLPSTSTKMAAVCWYPTLLPRPMAELHRGSSCHVYSLSRWFWLFSQRVRHWATCKNISVFVPSTFLFPAIGSDKCVSHSTKLIPLVRKWICIWIANLHNNPSVTEVVLIWKWCQNAIQPQQVRQEASGFTLLVPPYLQSQINMRFNALQFSLSEDIRTKCHLKHSHTALQMI